MGYADVVCACACGDATLDTSASRTSFRMDMNRLSQGAATVPVHGCRVNALITPGAILRRIERRAS